MSDFIVFRHNHSGWIRTVHESPTAADAMRSAVYEACPWLSQYPHDLKINEAEERYTVDYTGDPRSVALGRTQYAGYWFGDPIRIGAKDECPACGGTGRNHYRQFAECWKCGDGKSMGSSSGKKSEGRP